MSMLEWILVGFAIGWVVDDFFDVILLILMLHLFINN